MVNDLNPILLSLGPFIIRWYGLLLAIGTLISILLLRQLFKRENIHPDLAINLGIQLTLAGLVGARIGHVIFYNLNFFLNHPWEILFINHGGLSSHGLALGIIATLVYFVKKNQLPWKQIADLVIIPVPLLAAFIRLGNFFNSELIGRITNLPWGVHFIRAEYPALARHPSQIYESLLALLIFFIIYCFYQKGWTRRPLFLTSLFLFLYFSTRFLVEFVKDFPLHWGFTTGQWLSLPFLCLAVIFWRIKK
ncbi:MAG TPA: prolipoprotein diacylglyceryl transferase [Patescibacteria group bacterium]|nr:prolipoprotein diacylglyceryl transferase [Patescibacteria group bacterium]